jgi:uracil-DNA glycosylase
MTILFIGSNPSTASSTTNAFCESTKSGRTLNSWIKRIDLPLHAMMINVSSEPTKNNKPLTAALIKNNLPRLKSKINYLKPDKIVALGKVSAKALTLLGIHFYEMPHPSGLNRQLNDISFIEEKINGLKTYILSPSGNIS